MKYALSVLAISIFIQVKAQNPIYKDTINRIHWANQFPSRVKGNKSASSGWFSKLLFGKKKESRIIKPMAVLKTNSDFYFVLDQGYGNIFKIRSKDEKITKLFKKNKFNFTSLVGFCITNDNDILFTDSRLNNVFKFNIRHKKLSILNSHYKFKRPTGIAYSKVSNEIWVVETAAHRIVILNNKGELIRTIGKRGIAKGEFNYPTSIWIDATGKVYVVDALNFRIQIFNKEGKVISVFGEAGNATGYFARPKGIATDSYGNIYVTDALFHTIQIFDISGKYLYKFGKQGTGKEHFWMPSGIYIDNEDYIYISDTYNSRIQIFKLKNED